MAVGLLSLPPLDLVLLVFAYVGPVLLAEVAEVVEVKPCAVAGGHSCSSHAHHYLHQRLNCLLFVGKVLLEELPS